jgi:proline iminopeptidase
MSEIKFGDEHVQQYRESNGEEGFEWRNGTHILLLTTTGRKSGNETTAPLIFGMDGDNPVIVASKGGAPEHPGWYKNLVKNPTATVQIKDEVFQVRPRDAEG